MNTKKRGELSELAFIYRATGLGFNVSKPYGDSLRYDFLIEHLGRVCKVQVKSTSQIQSQRYQLNCQRWGTKGRRAYLPSEVDFLAGHVVPCDAWYIFPISVIADKYHLYLCPQQPAQDRKHGKYREAWHLLEGFGNRSTHLPVNRLTSGIVIPSEVEGPFVSNHQLTRSPGHQINPDPRVLFSIDACDESARDHSKRSAQRAQSKRVFNPLRLCDLCADLFC